MDDKQERRKKFSIRHNKRRQQKLSADFVDTRSRNSGELILPHGGDGAKDGSTIYARRRGKLCLNKMKRS